MSLNNALSAAMDGLRVTQSQIAIVSGNIGNAQTGGYVRKTLDQVSTLAGDAIGARTTSVNRELDKLVQGQLRTETSGGSYAAMRARIYQQLQGTYGAPGSASGIDTLFNNFTSAMESLSSSPDSYSTQQAVLNSAQILTRQINSTSQSIQMLRSSAEQGIAGDVDLVNNALKQIANINQELLSGSKGDDTAASILKDQRDHYIDQLSQMMDVRIVEGDGNQIYVFTGSGDQLVSTSAAQLAFNAHGTITPSTQWNANPSLSGVGTITLVSPSGMKTDLIANGSIRSGELAAYLEMRDQALPKAQRQLDEFAARMSQALSDLTTAGTPVIGPQSGFDVDVAGLLVGNSINISYTDALSTQHSIKIVRVNDPSVLPLTTPDPTNPNLQVVGIDFSAGLASVVNQLNTALGPTAMQFSNPAGTTLRILNDVANTISVDAASTTTTIAGLTSGNLQLPFFVDGANPFTDAIAAGGAQMTGYSSRISINPGLLANPFSLTAYQVSTLAGDSARPDFMYNQLKNASLAYSSDTGIGGAASPFAGPLSSFVSKMLAMQGEAADNAKNLDHGQELVVNALRQRFDEKAGVNIDQEMTNLLALQNSYAANARVFSTIKQMFDVLLNM
jgi:flagellar hook-associated protein 1 FlgK